MAWYYTQDGAQQGPIAADELAKLIETGALRANEKVFGPGTTRWISPAEAAPLLGITATVPPPLLNPDRGGSSSMVKVVVWVIVFACLGGGVWWWTVGKAYYDVTARVRSALIDPDSAEFRDVVVGRTSACGEVNSRNRMGGYTGFQKFYMGESGVNFVSDNPETRALEMATFNTVCTMAKVDQRL
jgi:hypothetical protein